MDFLQIFSADSRQVDSRKLSTITGYFWRHLETDTGVKGTTHPTSITHPRMHFAWACKMCMFVNYPIS